MILFSHLSDKRLNIWISSVKQAVVLTHLLSSKYRNMEMKSCQNSALLFNRGVLHYNGHSCKLCFCSETAAIDTNVLFIFGNLLERLLSGRLFTELKKYLKAYLFRFGMDCKFQHV